VHCIYTMRLEINCKPPKPSAKYEPFVQAARAAGMTQSDDDLMMLLDAPAEVGADIEEFDPQPSFVIGQA
jgi:hypothetical protein